MKRKIIKVLSLLLCLTLQSCILDDMINVIGVLYELINNGNQGYINNDSGKSLDNLNLLFNGSSNETRETYQETTYPTGIDNIYITKNNHDLPYYKYYGDTIGNQKGLVIPIDFSDYPIDSNEIAYSFPNDSYRSVSKYYYDNSYGKLNISFDIMPWYRASYSSNYYRLNNQDYDGTMPGVSALIDEVISFYNERVNYKDYDLNNDGYIDYLYIIYSRPFDAYSNDTFYWAFQYCYLDQTKYDNVSPYTYVFASYDFIHGKNNDIDLTAEVYIHESGHLFTLQDYYDYSYDEYGSGCDSGGMSGADIMDNSQGDHNAFSKISNGWIDHIGVVNTDTYVTYTLKANSDNVLLLSNNYNEDDGIFQEYFILEFYDNTKELKSKFYTRSGIRILHVSANLNDDNEPYYLYDNSYTDYNLLNTIIPYLSRGYKYSSSSPSAMFCKDSDLLKRGTTVKYLYFNDNSQLNYIIKCTSNSNSEATVTIYNKDYYNKHFIF